MIDVIVDTEANGPCPGVYSLLEIGAVVCDGKFDRTFIAQIRPRPECRYIQDALNAIGRTHEETLQYPEPEIGIRKFHNWLMNLGDRPIFWSDNVAFDWQWINYEFARLDLKNPFGFSGRRIGDVYSGFSAKFRDHTSWKRLRKTAHTHDGLSDALGNAEALWQIRHMSGWR